MSEDPKELKLGDIFYCKHRNPSTVEREVVGINLYGVFFRFPDKDYYTLAYFMTFDELIEGGFTTVKPSTSDKT